MRQVEIQAFSVEEAVRLALEQLGRSRDQVSVEVLATDPGSEEVLVRVTSRDTDAPASDDEVSPRGRRGLAPAPAPAPAARREPEVEREAAQPRPERLERPERSERPERPERDRDRPRGGGRYERPGGERPVERASSRPAHTREETPHAEEESADIGGEDAIALDDSVQARPLAPGEHASPEDAIAPMAAEVLQKILGKMKVRGRIIRRESLEEGEAAFPDDEPSLILNVTGLSERDQNGLIGRRGETLDALQFLLNLVVGRQSDLWTRVIVDVEGYRLRRKFALITLARRTAEQVQARNQAIPLEAMPPYERRIIHMTLSEHPSVSTESAGVEPDRRVVVLPK